MQVSQMMVEPTTIDKDQRLSYALDMLEKNNTDRLVVTQNGKLTGILTYADIADRLGVSKVVAISISRLHVSSAMTSTVITVQPDDDIIDVCKLMVERGMSGCPVLDDNEDVVGVIGKFDITRLIQKFEEIPVKKLMTRENLLVANPVDRLIKARLDMLNEGVSGLPVTDGRRVLGLLTEKLVAQAMARFSVEVPDKHKANQIRKIRVVDAMLKQPPLVEPDTPISQVAQRMLEDNLNTLPVVEEGNLLIGVISTTDFAIFAANKFQLPEKTE